MHVAERALRILPLDGITPRLTAEHSELELRNRLRAAPCSTSALGPRSAIHRRGDRRHIARAGLAWFARWLKRDVSVDTGAPFEWIADDGVWRSGPDYPLAAIGSLNANGGGALRILPLDGITPRLTAERATVRFSSPTSGGDIVGEPVVKLVYRGSALPSRTFLYAQILDGNRVAGGRTTPIPVVLDGRTHTIEQSLETLALRTRRESNLRLQIRSGANAYSPQRSLGNVHLMSIQAMLPLIHSRKCRSAASAVRQTR